MNRYRNKCRSRYDNVGGIIKEKIMEFFLNDPITGKLEHD